MDTFDVDCIEDCYWPVERMKAAVSESLGEKEFRMNDRLMRAGLFLFGCALVGPNAPRVSIATGLDQGECCWFGIQARRIKVIAHGAVDDKPWIEGDPMGAAIHFLLDCMVVAGRCKCVGERGPSRKYLLKNR